MPVPGSEQIRHIQGFAVLFTDLEQGSGDSPDHLFQKTGPDQPDPNHGIAGLVQILTGKGGHRQADDLGLDQGPDRRFTRISARSLEHPEVMLPHQERHGLLHRLFIQTPMNPPGNIPPLRKIRRALKEIVAVLLLSG
jgi:hypothetical protein